MYYFFFRYRPQIAQLALAQNLLDISSTQKLLVSQIVPTTTISSIVATASTAQISGKPITYKDKLSIRI